MDVWMYGPSLDAWFKDGWKHMQGCSVYLEVLHVLQRSGMTVVAASWRWPPNEIDPGENFAAQLDGFTRHSKPPCYRHRQLTLFTVDHLRDRALHTESIEQLNIYRKYNRTNARKHWRTCNNAIYRSNNVTQTRVAKLNASIAWQTNTHPKKIKQLQIPLLWLPCDADQCIGFGLLCMSKRTWAMNRVDKPDRRTLVLAHNVQSSYYKHHELSLRYSNALCSLVTVGLALREVCDTHNSSGGHHC